ncbi:MAG: ABC transporter substrate-binding protein [Desulfovibrionaceae bacterium]|nr:ABC transporter substrate-binding protein [Desulfovibrionaceae bacterium]
MNKNAAEIMRVLGVQDRIVGISRWLDKTRAFWPELANAAYVGTFNDPDLEAVAALRPDLVLAYGHTPGPELEAKLTPFGIDVLRLDLHKYADFHRDVTTLGRVFGREAAAREFLDWEAERVRAVERCTAADAHRPTVYMESYGAFFALGPGSSGHERCTLANGANLGAELSAMRVLVSPEWVMARDPEVVVKSGSFPDTYATGSPVPLEEARRELLRRPGLRETRAAGTGRVYVLNADIYTGPRTVVALAYLARWLHPATCADIDPRALHAEYMARFQHMPLRDGSATPPDVAGDAGTGPKPEVAP